MEEQKLNCTCHGRDGVELNKFRHMILKPDRTRERVMLCENCYKAVTGENGHGFANKHTNFDSMRDNMNELIGGY